MQPLISKRLGQLPLPAASHLRTVSLVYKPSPLGLEQRRHFDGSVLALGAVGLYSAFFLRWRDRIMRPEYDKFGHLHQGSSGPVQYALHNAGGSGATVDNEDVFLFVHGTPGGCDQFAHMASLLAELPPQLQLPVVCPSRPGYMKTPLSSGRSLAGQARLMHDLLGGAAPSAKGVHLIALGAGTPYALKFAALYGGLVKSLVLLAPCVKRDAPAEAAAAAVARLRAMGGENSPTAQAAEAAPRTGPAWLWDLSEFTQRTMLATGPAGALTRALVKQLKPPHQRSSYEIAQRLLKADPKIAEYFSSLAGLAFMSSKVGGYAQDMWLMTGVAEEPEWTTDTAPLLRQVAAPTLLLASEADGVVDFSNAEFAMRHLPNAVLKSFPSAPHLLHLTEGPAVRAALRDFYCRELPMLTERAVEQRKLAEDAGQ